MQELTAEPNGSPPVAVSSKDIRVALTGHIADAVLLPTHVHRERQVFVYLGEGSDPKWRQEFVFVEHVPQHAEQLVLCGNGQ